MAATHQGLCGACFRTFRVVDRGGAGGAAADPRLARHGYRRPYGRRHESGRCLGSYGVPDERSPEVARAARADAARALAWWSARAADLEAGTAAELFVEGAGGTTLRIEPGHARWALARDRARVEARANARMAEAARDRLDAHLATWTARALAPLAAPPGADATAPPSRAP